MKLSAIPLCLSLLTGCVELDAETETSETVATIIGGTDALIRDNPWQVSLRRLAPDGWYRHSCGGSIVRTDWIVTAAHCVAGIPPSELLVIAGAQLLEVPVPYFPGYERRIAQVEVHPQWDGGIGNDIALIRLTEALPITPDVKPIALATPEESAAGLDAPGKTARITGWGLAGKDLVKNGDFELGANTSWVGWKTGYVSAPPELPLFGARSAKFKLHGVTGLIRQSVPVVPHTEYQFSLWIDTLDVVEGGGILADVTWRNGTTVVETASLGCARSDPQFYYLCLRQLVSPGTATNALLTIKAPPGIGTAYVDSVSVLTPQVAPNRLQQAVPTIMDDHFLLGLDPAQHVLVRGANGAVGACNGDSGGPLVATPGVAPRLIGVASAVYRFGEGGQTLCHPDIPSIYTRVSNHAAFLAAHLP